MKVYRKRIKRERVVIKTYSTSNSLVTNYKLRQAC